MHTKTRQFLTVALASVYLLGAVGDYLYREGVAKGLWHNILWRDGALPLLSFGKSLLWPIRIFVSSDSNNEEEAESSDQTTAQKLVRMFRKTYNYPICSDNGCVLAISAQGNTVIADYSIPMSSDEFGFDVATNKERIATMLRPEFVKKLCSEAQEYFPDRNMKWTGRLFSSEGASLATITMTMSECP